MPRKRGLGTKKGRKPHKGFYHPPEQVVGGHDPESIWNHMLRFTLWQRERGFNYRPDAQHRGPSVISMTGAIVIGATRCNIALGLWTIYSLEDI